MRNIVRDLLQQPALTNIHLALQDINEQRLQESLLVAKQIIQALNVPATVSVSQNRKDVLAGANVVITMFQVGGYKPATVVDFEIPKQFGLRQTIADTLGVGGIIVITSYSIHYTKLYERIAMADYQMEALSAEINLEAARLARKVADEWTAKTPEKPRFVAGVLGPTNRTASISPDVNDPGKRNVTFDQLVEAYIESTEALIEGGADIILV